MTFPLYSHFKIISPDKKGIIISYGPIKETKGLRLYYLLQQFHNELYWNDLPEVWLYSQP